MAYYDRSNGGHRGGYNNRKRRYRGKISIIPWQWQRPDMAILEDDDYDRRPQRRRYEEPAHIKVRKLLLGIAESVQEFSS